MPKRNADPRQQFVAVEELLTRWLRERREVLGRYTELVVAAQSGLDDDSIAQRQQALCTLLVDYASAGHFEVYNELVNEAECFGEDTGLAERLMPAIGDTTEIIIAYEEKYGGSEGRLKNMKRDIAALGEVLESRFVLEDQLIAGLHGSHRGALEGDAPLGG